MNKLPVIDFSNLKQDTPTWESVKIQVRQALEEYGCFEAIFDEIPLNLRKSIIDGLQQLFDLPLENKIRNKSNSPYRGYIGQHPAIPLYESLGIEDDLSPGKIECFTNLMWCEGNPTFRLQKYDAPKSNATEIGLKSHTDKNIVTILYGNEVKGLEVLTKDGKWINADHSLNSYIVVIGDSFHAVNCKCSNTNSIRSLLFFTLL
ncbi:hypothetical protein DH2020_041349 [Rehmannia glutinosa]|uniref:Uncharacterized protein n=1 Tax=Rehmannia glutinosa TaxID=99300 RepID=A0ABR0USI3_REHGL